MRPRHLSALLLAVPLTISCGGDATGPEAIAGTYTLRTVGGENLPYVMEQVGQDKVEVTADEILLNETGSFRTRTTLRTTDDGNTSTETRGISGMWVLSGNQITLITIDGITITIGTQRISCGRAPLWANPQLIVQ